jgi:hypothetical protein
MNKLLSNCRALAVVRFFCAQKNTREGHECGNPQKPAKRESAAK